MKIILLYVASLDGKLTKWGNPDVHEWTSDEDAKHFLKVRDENNLICMGSKTFETVKPIPTKNTLRIVMTKDPTKFSKQTIPGQLEFSDESPEQLVKRLETNGFTQMLLVSGKTLTSAFFEKKLINELWITIEPKLFGLGDPLLEEKKIEINLKLISTKQLNPQGTLLLKYTIVNP